MKQKEKNDLMLLIGLMCLQDANIKPEDFIDGFDRDRFLSSYKDHPYLNDETRLMKDLKIMINQLYKKISKN